MCWRSSAIDVSTDSRPRLTLWPKRILYLGLGILIISLARGQGLSWKHALLWLLPLLALEGLLQFLVRRRLPRLEGELMARLQAGRSAELLPLLEGETFLAFAGPRHYLQSKLGVVYHHLGQHRAAVAAFREALEEAPPARRLPLHLGLADSLYASGEADEAESSYRQALAGGQRNARACAHLARLILKRGGDAMEAEGFLRLAVEDAGGGKLRCELIHLLLREGKTEEATWQLGLAVEQLEHGSEEERSLLHQAREAVEAASAAR